jgi:site-specific DNA-methyltransferase (adenine-specific)
MELKKIELSKIKPYEKNARKNDEAVEYVVKSIQQCEYIAPIILDENNVILAGHTRYKALKKLGYKEAECVIKEGLTEEQKKKYRLLDNKTAEFADWDFDLLKDELDGIDFGDLEIDWGIDVELNEEQEVIEDEIPDAPEEPKSKYGDIYQLGNHRLMCGDSTKKEDIEKLMNGEKADLLFTDPPYNVSIESKSKQILNSDNYSHIENDDLPIEEFKKFLDKIFKNANLILNDDASYYVFACQGGDNELMMMMMMRENGLKCRHQIIWVKDAPVFSMGRLDYDYKHEPILYGWKKRHNFYRKGEQDKSVWEYKRTANKLHPTMKPVELICNAILNSTKEKDNIIDLFGGSGSTLIACEQLNRKCYTMEIDPHYADVIIERWENLTGQKAVKINE